VIVVVTGGSGFLGSHVVEELVGRGHTVRIFDAQPLRPETAALDRVTWVPGDLANRASVVAGFADAEAVCHLAGVGDVYLAGQQPHTAALLNVVGSANVGEAAHEHRMRKVVYASTWEVYGPPEYEPIDEAHPCRPDHPYNITKYAGERILLSYDALHDLPVLALRLGTAYGHRMRPNSVFSLFIGRASRGESITIQGSGEQSRQFTHARDIARAFALGLEADARGMALNTVAEETVSVRRLAELVTARLPTAIEHAPPRPGEVVPARVSADKAARVIGWRATIPFRQGLDELIDAHVAAPAGA
jgi:nucleoside-diphosphate-sugar epimerase